MTSGETHQRTGRIAPKPNPGQGFDPGPWQKELRGFLAKMGAAADLDDLLQETFLRAVRRPPEGPARAYLYRVALNLFRDRNRHRQRTVRVLERAARIDRKTTADPADAAERRDLAARAWKVIQTLPDHQRAALILRIDRQFTYREAARVLGCSEATVRQHFYLGMKAVRTVLTETSDG